MSASTVGDTPEVIDLVSDDSSDSSDSENEVQEVLPRARPSHRLLHRQTVYTPPADDDEMADQANPGAQELPLPYIDVNEFEYDEQRPLRGSPAIAAPEKHLGPGQIINIDGEEVFIPDSPDPGPQLLSADSDVIDEPVINLDDHPFTADHCLARVLEIFPDISHEHVFELYNKFDIPGDYQSMDGHARYENIVEQLISAESYPKQGKGKQAQKRKRDEDEVAEANPKRWEGPDREVLPHHLKGAMEAMIKAEFPEVPNEQIKKLLKTNKHFYQTYVAVANMKDTSQHTLRGRPRSNGANADTIGANSGSQVLLEELAAARAKVISARADRAAADARKRAEHESLQRAMAAGETAECQACFEQLPMNRQMHCNGAEPHFTCLECAETYIKSEVGESRCRVLCTAGCGAGFAYAQLHLLDDKKLLRRLEQLQQEKDIRDAGLDDLEECPFCDYKAILPPIEEDFEFRCANEECEKVSCRRCKAVSHIPRSCEEYAQENKIDTRHKIEEAMTAAMLRSCNKCKKQFIKEHGCNKMSCPSCRNLQCYVCSKDITDYNHFAQGPGMYTAGGASNKCPLYDNVEERHEREVKEAEATARAAVMAENPDVTEEDLKIKVSDAVNKATQERIRVANPAGRMPGFAIAHADHLLGHRYHGGAADVNQGHDGHGNDEGDNNGENLGPGAVLRGVRARLQEHQRELVAQQIQIRQQRQAWRARQAMRAQQRLQMDVAFQQGLDIGRQDGIQPVYGPAVALQQAAAPRIQPQPLAAAEPDVERFMLGQGFGVPMLDLQEPQANDNLLGGQAVGGDIGAQPVGVNNANYDRPRPLPVNDRYARFFGLGEHFFGDGDVLWPAQLPAQMARNNVNNNNINNNVDNNNNNINNDIDNNNNAAPAPGAARRAVIDRLRQHRQHAQNLFDANDMNEGLGLMRAGAAPGVGGVPNAPIPLAPRRPQHRPQDFQDFQAFRDFFPPPHGPGQQ